MCYISYAGNALTCGWVHMLYSICRECRNMWVGACVAGNAVICGCMCLTLYTLHIDALTCMIFCGLYVCACEYVHACKSESVRFSVHACKMESKKKELCFCASQVFLSLCTHVKVREERRNYAFVHRRCSVLCARV